MKKALVVLVVVVLVVTGLPLLVAMTGMASCRDCGPAVLAGGPGCVLAVLMTGAALAVALAVRLDRRDLVMRLLLHTVLIERPPRLA